MGEGRLQPALSLAANNPGEDYKFRHGWTFPTDAQRSQADKRSRVMRGGNRTNETKI
jgi:hypothetical protein